MESEKYRVLKVEKPPLCKGRWQKSILIFAGGVVNPSVFFFACGKEKSSSLYTREPCVCSYRLKETR